MLFSFKIDVAASPKLLHLSLNSVRQIPLDSSQYLLMRINAVSALRRHMLKMTILKATQMVHLRKYNYGTVGITRSVRHLDMYKENTSLRYSSFLKLLKPQDTNAQEERREKVSQVCSHYSNIQNCFESN